MYAFLSNDSALDALRYLRDDALTRPRWPLAPRKLPRYGDSVATQRAFKAFSQENDLERHGVTKRPVDLLVPTRSERSRGKEARLHVWKGDIPAGALVRLGEQVFASTPQFVLLQMAAHNYKRDPLARAYVEECRAESAVAQTRDATGPLDGEDPFAWRRKEHVVRMALVACEFAGTYRLGAGDHDTAYRLAPLMTLEEARTFANRVPRLYGGARVQAALDLAFDRSASPMESALAMMLSLPVDYGGFGLPRPTLNEALPTGEFSSLWDGGDSITPDLLWKDARVVIEYESDEFHASQGARKATDDATRANVLSALDYTVLRATTGSVTSQVELGRLATQVATALGGVLAEPDGLTSLRRHKMHALLMQQ